MESKKCFNFMKTGFCRFAANCRYSHVIEEREVVFRRMEAGKGLGEELNKDVKVHLDTDKREELRKLLLSIDFENNKVEDGVVVSGNFEDISSSSSSVEKEFERKYSHIPDSSFKNMFKMNFLGNNKTCSDEPKTFKSTIERNSQLDYQLREEILTNEKKSLRYKEMQDFRQSLPVYEKRSEILNYIENNQVIVISGETGSGKTTQVAQYILDDYIMKYKGSICHVVCTQPRRISAISVSQRIAEERGDTCGGDNSSIGYQVRLDKALPRKQGSILFCTTGVVLKWMQSDPGLSKISHIIIDEIHERDVNSDFALTVLRELVSKRPDLKIILMSATLNSSLFAAYFNNCPTLDIEGHLFDVNVYYLEHVLTLTSYVRSDFLGRKRRPVNASGDDEFHDFIGPYVSQLSSRFSDLVLQQLLMPESEQIDLQLILQLIEFICDKKEDGGILVFLPGWDHISTLTNLIYSSSFFCKTENRNEDEAAAVEVDNGADDGAEAEAPIEVTTGAGGQFWVLPLHSQLPAVEQKAVFLQPPPGVRKIVISTNISETSITISDVVYVVDSGKMKVNQYDIENNISMLRDEWVSQANATQRKGRAGRAQAGECYRLYTKARFDRLPQFPLPGILRMRLEELVLHIKVLELGKAKTFLNLALDVPNTQILESSIKFLQTLNALDDDENLTPLGYHLAKLPLDPQMGKLIIMGAIFSCVDPIFSVAACLSEKDPFYVPVGQQKKAAEAKLKLSQGTKSDHLLYANTIKLWEEATLNKKGGKFCKVNFLSRSVLKTLRNLKKEFAAILHEMGFLETSFSNHRSSNTNSENSSLVKAIICAALYPNVAMVESVEIFKTSGRVDVNLKTPEDGKVKLHPVSVNGGVRRFESPYLVYHKKLKSSYIFLHDTTMISSLPLIIFGHKIRRGARQILVNDSVSFCCEETVSILVESLRIETGQILDKMILNPGTVDWNSNDPETKVLRSLVELISAEDEKILPKPVPEPVETKSKVQKKKTTKKK